MKKILVIAVLLMAAPAFAANYTDWTQPFDVDANTMGLWHFDELAGDATVTDATGNNPDGTMAYGLDENQLWVTSTVPYANFGNMASTWYDAGTNTWNNGAIKVAGTGDNATDPLWGGPNNDLTIEFWARETYDWDTPWRFMVEKSGGYDYYVAWYEPSPNPMIAGWAEASDPSGPDASSDWHHYAVCLDRTTDDPIYTDRVTFFRDGVLYGSQTTDLVGAWYQAAGDLYILSNSSGTNSAFADMDELRISNVIRYPAEVIPEPSMISLLAVGLASVLRRKK